VNLAGADPNIEVRDHVLSFIVQPDDLRVDWMEESTTSTVSPSQAVHSNLSGRLVELIPLKLWTKIRQAPAIAVLLLAVTIYSIFFSWVTVQRYAAFDSSLDLGSNLALIEGVIRGWQPAWALITHEGALFSYVFVPLVWAAPNANDVLIAQTIFIASGAVPLFFFSRLKLRNEVLALTVALSYLVCPSIQALNWFDFHPEILGMPFIFAFFYYYEIHQAKLATVFCFLTLSVSTTVAAGIAVWLLADCLISLNEWRVRRNQWRLNRNWYLFGHGLTVAAICFLAGVALLTLHLTQGIGVVTGQAGINQTYPGIGNSPLSILLAPLLSPHAFASNLLFQLNLKVLYLVLLFGLFLFLPFLDFRALAGTLPWLYLAISSQNTVLYTVPYFQYSALLIPFLYFGFVNVVSKRGIPFLEDWGLLWFSVVIVVPFAISPPYFPSVFDSYATLFLVVPAVVVLTLALRKRRDSDSKGVSRLDFRAPVSPFGLNPSRGTNPAGTGSILEALKQILARAFGLVSNTHLLERRRRPAVVGLFAVVAILLFSLWTPYGILSSQYVGAYEKPTVTPHDNAFNQILALLPQNATILAQDHLYAHLWKYRFVSVHPTPGAFADFILGDVGQSGEYQPDYFEPIVTPFPALSQIVLQNLTSGNYGIYAEADGYFLLERNYTGAPQLFSPVDDSINPCSLDTLPTANMECVNDALIQTSNPDGTSTVWYGPYDTLPPGNFTVTFQIRVNRTLPGVSPVTLGVYSYLPGPIPVSETLSSVALNSSDIPTADSPANFTLNFSVPYPAFIQFVGNYEAAGVMVDLLSLHYEQVSTEFVNLETLITRLLPEHAVVYTQASLVPLFGWRVNVVNNVTNETQFVLADTFQSDFYSPATGGNSSSMADAIYSLLSSHQFGVLAESSGYLLLERGHLGPPMLFTPLRTHVDPCTLNTFPSSEMECEGDHLTQTMNTAGAATLWYGPYETLPPGNFTVTFQLELNATPRASPVTLGVYSFLPATHPISQTLASHVVNSSEIGGAELSTNVTLSFDVVYPALIQFAGTDEPPGLLLTLLALSYFQQSS
jgi:uncharacterized membrane protein